MKRIIVSPGQRQAMLLLLDEMCESANVFDTNLFSQSKFEHAEKLIFYHQTTDCKDRKFVVMRNLLDTIPLIDDVYKRKTLLNLIMPILQANFPIHEQTILSWSDPDGTNYVQDSEITLFMEKTVNSI